MYSIEIEIEHQRGVGDSEQGIETTIEIRAILVGEDFREEMMIEEGQEEEIQEVKEDIVNIRQRIKMN